MVGLIARFARPSPKAGAGVKGGVAPRPAGAPQDIFINKEALVVALVLGTGAGAEGLCRFDIECFEGERCGASGFELRVGDEVLGTEFGDLPIVARVGGALVAEAAGAVYLLSRGDAGARLAVHMEGPMAVTYIGACE